VKYARRFPHILSATLVSVTLAACSGDKNPTSPTTTTGGGGGGGGTTNPPANRAPTINSMSATPGFGVATLTAFAMTASGSDPDGDPVTFEWDFGDGTRATGAALSKTYLTSGVATVSVTASDGRGGTATDRRTITVGSLNGNWAGTMNFGGGANEPATMSLTQVGGVVSGTMTVRGFNGRTDPAQLGRIDSNGAVEIRWKVDPFLDFTMRGQMDATGTRISGGLFGSGFNGEPFVFDKR
jgi:hypothetical protein